MSATFDDVLNAFDAAQHHYLNGDPGPARAMAFHRRASATPSPIFPTSPRPGAETLQSRP